MGGGGGLQRKEVALRVCTQGVNVLEQGVL